MRYRIYLAICVLAGIGMGLSFGYGCAQASALQGRPHHHQLTLPAMSQYDSAIIQAGQADVGDSIQLPGQNIWTFGDATSWNGTSTLPDYPHNEFMFQSAGQAVFDPLTGQGTSPQQVPNWDNGDYFWPASMLYANGNIYLFGERVHGFTVTGDYVATFDEATLTYLGITATTGIDNWSNPQPVSGGYEMIGTRFTGAPHCLSECFTGDLAFIPAASITDSSRWVIVNGALPATDHLGAVVSPIKVGLTWKAFTKMDDQYGSNTIEGLSAPSMAGPWVLTGKTWPAPVPAHCVSYSVQAHVNEGEPAGQVLLTYAVNDDTSKMCPQYSLDFLEVTP